MMTTGKKKGLMSKIFGGFQKDSCCSVELEELSEHSQEEAEYSKPEKKKEVDKPSRKHSCCCC